MAETVTRELVDWTGVQPDHTPIPRLDDQTFAGRLRLLSERAESLTRLRTAFTDQAAMASNFLEILSQLHDHHVDFVIVGGVAAALHGSSRVTFDLDVVPNLTEKSWQAAVDLLWSLGARPRIPESLERIRDIDQVRGWQRDKGMLALNFRTPDGSTEVDLLVSESDQFASLRERAVKVTIDQRTFFVASIDDLIAMKRHPGRPQDLLDIAQLQEIQKRLERPDR